MGKVVASFKIFPSGVEVNLEKLKETIKQKLPTGVTVYKFEEEPLAFGLKVLIAHIIIPEDIEGEMDKVEDKLKEIEDVSQIQILMVRKIS